MRQAKACVACRTPRERRRRCEINTPGSSCWNCLKRRLACTSSDLPTKIQSQYEQSPFPIDEATPQFTPSRKCFLPAQSLCIELVRLYFKYVHDQFHTLFHEPSFLEDLENGQAPPVLLFGMMALSARFSTNSYFSNRDPRERGRVYAKECERLLDWNDVSITTIYACVLLGAIAITDGKPASESIHYAVACRIAQLLDLPNCQASSKVDQEVNIRTWWTLSMIDVWSSTGVRLPKLLAPKPAVPLPMEEETLFHLRRSHKFDVQVRPDRRSSLLAEMVRLNRILQQINDFNIRASEYQLDSVAITSDVENLSKQLDTWL